MTKDAHIPFCRGMGASKGRLQVARAAMEEVHGAFAPLVEELDLSME